MAKRRNLLTKRFTAAAAARQMVAANSKPSAPSAACHEPRLPLPRSSSRTVFSERPARLASSA